MKVFLSWSGEKSRRVANVLRDWLPSVAQWIEPWLAATDIEPGSRWRESIDDALSGSDAAIICVTRTNQESRWLAYETAALTKILSVRRIIPLAIDLPLAELSGPLAQHQGVTTDPADMRRLMETLASENSELLPSSLLDLQIERLMERLPLAAGELVVSGMGVGVIGDHGTVHITADGGNAEVLAALGSRLDTLFEAVAALSDRIVTSQVPGPPIQSSSVPGKGGRPSLFIGSSVENKKIADAIQLELQYEVDGTIWSQDIFRAGFGTLETLVDAAAKFDFAVIVMTADDILIKRGLEHRAPRDNLIFEIGLFTGRLGRGRAFVVHPRDVAIEFPSDFNGTTMISFQMERPDRNLQAAVGPACTQIRRAMGI